MRRRLVALVLILLLALPQPVEAMVTGKRLNQPVLFHRPPCKVCVEIPHRENAMPL